ncbi:hypothetical protein AVEN_173580-1 [Araneus ventricosus]|uniref:Uncharacterized protein n=1 Tax=Araneus ventricosus TaxID=182803 RepID=A0A4Y2CT06_ARAVE|nr:hypothetical protein AVEN_173580-1 [Araneus ventricosus]
MMELTIENIGYWVLFSYTHTAWNIIWLKSRSWYTLLKWRQVVKVNASITIIGFGDLAPMKCNGQRLALAIWWRFKGVYQLLDFNPFFALANFLGGQLRQLGSASSLAMADARYIFGELSQNTPIWSKKHGEHTKAQMLCVGSASIYG